MVEVAKIAALTPVRHFRVFSKSNGCQANQCPRGACRATPLFARPFNVYRKCPKSIKMTKRPRAMGCREVSRPPKRQEEGKCSLWSLDFVLVIFRFCAFQDGRSSAPHLRLTQTYDCNICCWIIKGRKGLIVFSNGLTLLCQGLCDCVICDFGQAYSKWMETQMKNN